MNKNYLQVRSPQDLRKIANINLAIDTAYNESEHYVAPKELQAIKDFIIEKSIFENYERGENLNPRDNYYFSKNVFEMFKKYPWKILINEFSNINDVKIIKKIKWDSKLKNINKIEEKINKVNDNQLKGSLNSLLKAYNERNR